MALKHIEFKKPIARKLLSVQTVNAKGALHLLESPILSEPINRRSIPNECVVERSRVFLHWGCAHRRRRRRWRGGGSYVNSGPVPVHEKSCNSTTARPDLPWLCPPVSGSRSRCPSEDLCHGMGLPPFFGSGGYDRRDGFL